MGIFEGCLLASDIDGTLVSNGFIHPRNIEKIEYFMREGGYFSLSTGRSVSAIGLVLSQLKNISPSVISNGCIIYDYENDKPLYQAVLPKEDYKVVKAVIENLSEIGVEVHAGKDVLTLSRTKETDDHQTYEGLPTVEMSYEEACKYNWNKVLFALDCDEDLEKLQSVISAVENSSVFVSTSATLYGRKRSYYEQIPPNITKATAIERLCDILNIKSGYKFAIGDYYNDLEMLENADISAVPENSPDDLKKIATFIAGKCEDGAVADFIDFLTELCSKRKEG